MVAKGRMLMWIGLGVEGTVLGFTAPCTAALTQLLAQARWCEQCPTSTFSHRLQSGCSKGGGGRRSIMYIPTNPDDTCLLRVLRSPCLCKCSPTGGRPRSA